MADKVKYKVLRAHLGDRVTDDGVEQHHFEVGETREADPLVVAHLVGTSLQVTEGKAEAPTANKAEGDSTKNKGAAK